MTQEELKKIRDRVLEEAAQEADKTAAKILFSKRKLGCLAAGRAIRLLKSKES